LKEQYQIKVILLKTIMTTKAYKRGAECQSVRALLEVVPLTVTLKTKQMELV